MIPPVAASTISSTFSAACWRSILAISGMLEPSASSRSRTGTRSCGGGDEGDGEQIDFVLGGELDPAEVAVGRGRQRGAAGDVHPLVGGERAADLDLAIDASPRWSRARAAGSPRRRGRRAGCRCSSVTPCQETGIRSRSPSISSGSGSRACPSRARRSRRAARRSAASARAGRRGSRPRGRPARGGADLRDRLRLAVGPGVGEVEPEDVGAGGDHLLEHGRRPARRADRGDDLGPAAMCAAAFAIGFEFIRADCRDKPKRAS